jgi:hypothetical protein
MVPLMLEGVNSQVEAFVEASAAIYARHFTVDELKQITAFYRNPVGQKMLEKLPIVTQESVVIGQKFGEMVGKQLQERMIQELRKQGHNI